MKNFTFLFTSALFALSIFQAEAQNKIKDADVSRQAENSNPEKNWVIYSRVAGEINFISDPASTPGNCGSLEFKTPLSTDKAFIYNFEHNGTPLSSITALSYATYQMAGNAIQVPAINIQIDVNGTSVAGGEAVLVFEPVYNTDQGAIIPSTWQIWDAFKNGNAIWWSTQPFNGICAFSCFVTWNQIVASNPQAVISGGFGLNQGSGNPGLISAADHLTIGKGKSPVSYNFELQSCGNSNTTSLVQLGQSTTTYNSLTTYPNPTTGEVNVKVPVLKAAKANIVVSNTDGTLVESRETKAEGQVEKFDLSNAGPGLYLIKVSSPNTVEHSKVVVQ